MTNFGLVALLPAGTTAMQVEHTLEGLLAPYEESLEVEPHTVICECLKWPAEAHQWNGRCGTCGGAGNYSTRQNPKGHWTGWAVGGISDGSLYPQGPSPASGSLGRLRRNMRTVSELPADFNWSQFPALMTEAGHWYDVFSMHRLYEESEIEEAWAFCVTHEIAQYPSAVAVAVNCYT